MKLVQASLSLGLLILVCLGNIAECQNQITLSPSTNQTVAFNSLENITYSCTVDNGRVAQWAFDDIQLTENSNSLNLLITEGLVIETGLSSQSTIIFTSRVRAFLISNLNIPVRCNSLSQSDVNIQFGALVFIRTFSIPAEVQNLDFNPFPGNISRLVLSWQPPTDTLVETGDPVITTYTITVSGPTFNSVDTTTQLTYELVDDPDMECAEHLFNVTASNDAGIGPSLSLPETIPISPTIDSLDSSLTIMNIILSSPTITADVTFNAATACSPNFPLLSYMVTVAIGNQSDSMEYPVSDSAVSGRSSITLPVPNSLLVLDMEYTVTVSACISVTCRQSTPRTLRTTDVQSAAITFFETNVFLQCAFPTSISGIGCAFRLTITTGDSETITVGMEDSPLCSQTMNMQNAYTNIEVVDWQSTDVFGTVATPVTINPLITDVTNYTDTTGCIPPSTMLSAGAIVGIVIGVILAVLLILAIAIVIAVVVYKKRVQSLPKMSRTDDERVFVDFEKNWLMDDSIALKKTGSLKKSKVSFRRGDDGNGVDGNDEVTLASADSLIPQSLSPGASGAATMPILSKEGSSLMNPSPAFTLHIDKGSKRVRLHLDKALIRKVLKDKRMTTLDRKNARSRTTGDMSSRQLLLPLHSEICVTGDDCESNHGSTDDVATNL